VYLVQTQDELGQPQVGSAFVLSSDAQTSYLVTSLSVVRAATKQPGPAITLRHGDETLPAAMHTWQQERDLALLRVDKGNLASLRWVPATAQLDLGQPVFVVAGGGTSITGGSSPTSRMSGSNTTPPSPAPSPEARSST